MTQYPDVAQAAFDQAVSQDAYAIGAAFGEQLARAIPETLAGEQLVLGGALANKAFRRWAVGQLTADDFYREAHRSIWQAIQACDAEAGAAQPELVAMKLAARGLLDACGGRPYLQAVQQQCWSVKDDVGALRAAAGDLRQVSTARELVKLSSDLQHRIAMSPGRAIEHLQHAQDALRGIASGVTYGGGAKRIGDVAGEFAAALEARRNAPPGIHGARTGIGRLDAVLRGLADQRLVLIFGRTGFGKSIWSCQTAFETAHHSAREYIGETLYYTQESSRDAILRRFVSWRGGVDAALLKTGGAAAGTEDDTRHIARVIAEFDGYPLRVTRELTKLHEVESDVRNIATEAPIALVVVDHAQAMARAMGGEERLTLANIATSLQCLADDLECPVILVSQMSTDMSGASYSMGSRSIDQNASLIIRIDRGEPGTTVEERQRSPEMQLSCLKGREGEPFGTIDCHADFARCRIYDQEQWAAVQEAERATRTR